MTLQQDNHFPVLGLLEDEQEINTWLPLPWDYDICLARIWLLKLSGCYQFHIYSLSHMFFL